MSMDTRLRDLTTRVATECKSIRTLLNSNQLDLSGLSTTSKTSIVSAINELKDSLTTITQSIGAVIDDSSSSSSKVWSGSKVQSEMVALHNTITNDAATTMATLAAITAELANDDNAAAAMSTAISNRVRFDTTQTLTAQQQNNALVNINAVSATNVGSTNTDYVTLFNTGLLS